MRIDGFIATYSPESLKSSSGGVRSKERSSDSSGSSRKDSVQISDEARQRLEKVRKRIENGFYDSESVAEDISDKLGGVLDEVTR